MASTNRSALTRLCFTALLVVGIGFLLIGMFTVPYLPYFQLDAVLNKVELADEEKKLATLTLLKRANGNAWLIWSVAGLLVSGLSAIGLWSSRTTRAEPPT
jgi:hypothetical protein